MAAHKGSKHHLAILTEDHVRAARKAHRDGASISVLATLYQVTEGAMRRAVLGKTWGHVKDGLTLRPETEEASLPDAA